MLVINLIASPKLQLLIEGLIKEKDKLKKIFTKQLVEHITNCLNHVKMFPYFIEMGYDRTKFIADSLENKCEIKYAYKIKNQFKFLGLYNKHAIDSYIGKFFAMKADISDFDYTKQYSILKSTDNELFQILNNFWIKWIHFNSVPTNAIDYWADNFAGDFIVDVELWLLNKKLI